MCEYTGRLKLILLLTFLLNIAAIPKKWQVHMETQKISDHNDTAYVRRIMQLAKSAEMSSYLQPEVDVCDNFYEFSCGNWPKVNPVDQNNIKTNIFSKLIDNYEQIQLNLLRNMDDEMLQNEENAYLLKVKSFFESCVNAENNEELRKDLRRIISEFGHMPALTPELGWSDDKFDWIETLAKIQNKYGIGIIMELSFYRDFVTNQNVTKFFLTHQNFELETKTVYLSEDYAWLQEWIKRGTKKILEDYLGVAKDRLDATANEIFEFEVLLAQGLPDFRQDSSLSLWNLRSLEQLNETYGSTIDFRRFISTAIGQPFNDSIYETSPGYTENLVKVIQKTPKRQIANYIYFQLIKAFLQSLLKPYAREKSCLEHTKQYFSQPLDRLAFMNFSTKDTKHDVELMWQKLKSTFKAELESEGLTWMSADSKKLALEKLEAMSLKINIYDEKNFNEEFANITITPNNSFLDNLKVFKIYTVQDTVSKMHNAPEPPEVPDMQTPAYISIENFINVPVIFLQPNFLWSDHYPEAIRYGTLGFLLAHELTHGFDDNGRNYDAMGNSKMWWDKSTNEGFDVRRKCIQHQYRRFRYAGQYLPESEVQTENIADNAAIQLAYRAYVNFLTEVQSLPSEEERAQILEMEHLPRLNYTNRQLFFISYAQFWCVDIIDIYKKADTQTDPHAPSMFRVIGPLANFDEFANAFQCAVGTTMNPKQKCHVY